MDNEKTTTYNFYHFGAWVYILWSLHVSHVCGVKERSKEGDIKRTIKNGSSFKNNKDTNETPPLG